MSPRHVYPPAQLAAILEERAFNPKRFTVKVRAEERYERKLLSSGCILFTLAQNQEFSEQYARTRGAEEAFR